MAKQAATKRAAETAAAGVTVGYARSSTTDQVAGFEAQQRDLRATGATRLFTEMVSSVAKREQLVVKTRQMVTQDGRPEIAQRLNCRGTGSIQLDGVAYAG